MRLDRWLRLKIGKIPQGLVEKYLRTGKIKLNRKKVKSSLKVKTKDEINIFNIEFKETIQQKKIKFLPSKEIIKSNEDQIIDNNDNFVVLNKGINKNLMLHSYQIRFKIKEVKHTYVALLPNYFKKLLKSKRLRFSNLK